MCRERSRTNQYLLTAGTQLVSFLGQLPPLIVLAYAKSLPFFFPINLNSIVSTRFISVIIIIFVELIYSRNNICLICSYININSSVGVNVMERDV